MKCPDFLLSFSTLNASVTNVYRMMDIMMMALMNGKERTIEDWKILFNKADSRFTWNGGNRPDGSRLWIITTTWEP